MKRILTFGGCFLLAVLAAVFLPYLLRTPRVSEDDLAGRKTGIFSQTAEPVSGNPVTVHRIYADGELIGVISDEEKLNRFLDGLYQDEYAEQFPGSRASLGENVYMTSEKSWLVYSDADQQIFDYLRDNNLISLSACTISFADENGVFDRIYVSDRKLYENAMQDFLALFISPDSFSLLTSGKQTPELTAPGSREVAVSVAEKITVGKGYASADRIMTTEQEVLDYLEYGGDTRKEYYTVQENDTVAGVGARNYGLSAEQIMSINRDVIHDVNQKLTPGQKLCVTYFTSPLTVSVTREVLREETIAPKTRYVQDENLAEGQQMVQEGIPGTRSALYQETWVNGVLKKGSLLSSVDTQQPVDEVISVNPADTAVQGSGDFAMPTDNAAVACGWECYEGHQGTDLVNIYDRYGDVYASDSGVILENGWNENDGNYMIIDHLNGYRTVYAHLNSPSPLLIGTSVKKGEVIGQIGMTGDAGGPHLHFAILEGKEHRAADPCGYLNCRGYQQ